LNLINGVRYFTFDASVTYVYVIDNSNTTLYYPYGLHTLSSVTTDLFITNANEHSII
jgi:hypothetical protein